ncbi:MAG: hypothetical protein CM1200mP6_02750 [Anaerolineaceae bacterium]|nr:MAG: hypothetical protein CM1200mP6_02750 [Anaerolineaceae bacterium]
MEYGNLDTLQIPCFSRESSLYKLALPVLVFISLFEPKESRFVYIFIAIDVIASDYHTASGNIP